MSKNMDTKKVANTNADAANTTSNAGSFEGKFISIVGNRLEVESDHAKKGSYALASDALMTCDGKVSKGESLKAGHRVRVTTQKGNSNMVTGIEWLSKTRSFPALKTAAGK